jgi:hypothetical protein
VAQLPLLRMVDVGEDVSFDVVNVMSEAPSQWGAFVA